MFYECVMSVPLVCVLVYMPLQVCIGISVCVSVCVCVCVCDDDGSIESERCGVIYGTLLISTLKMQLDGAPAVRK